MSSIMFCMECGNKIPDMAKFCPDCGFSQVSKKSKFVASTNDQVSKKSKPVAITNDQVSKKSKPVAITNNQVSKESKLVVSSNHNLPVHNEESNAKYIVGGVLLFLILIVIFSGGSGGDAQVQYDGCWAGAFHDGESIISISGCGNDSFKCLDSGFCSINAQKQDDSFNELCVKLDGDKACTTAEYGIAML